METVETVIGSKPTASAPRNGHHPSAAFLAARERRRSERERREQIPADLEPLVRRLYARGQWASASRSALDTVLDFHLGLAAIRRIVGDFAAHDARDLRAEIVEVSDLPFRDFSTIRIAESDGAAYRLREEFLV
jgi:hypothetical protein